LNLIYALRPRISAPQRRRRQRRQRRPTEPAGRHNAVRSRPSSVPRRSQLQSVELNAVGSIGCPATFGQVSDSAPIGSPRPAPVTVVRSFVRSFVRSVARARAHASVRSRWIGTHRAHKKHRVVLCYLKSTDSRRVRVHRRKPVPTGDRWRKNKKRQQRDFIFSRDTEKMI